MTTDAQIRQRFKDLQDETEKLWQGQPGRMTINGQVWHRWTTSVLSLLESVFGANSSHYRNYRKAYDSFEWQASDVQRAVGIFESARRDYEAGYLSLLEARVSGEIFGDFVTLAKRSLSEDNKGVAAVLACAALEDALKRYATANGINVDGKSMQDIVGALKAKSLVSGAQKTLLHSMPRIRDYAMHADWAKITPESVGSVIGFVETFLLRHFA
jgi:hypothetical protein